MPFIYQKKINSGFFSPELNFSFLSFHRKLLKNMFPALGNVIRMCTAQVNSLRLNPNMIRNLPGVQRSFHILLPSISSSGVCNTNEKSLAMTTTLLRPALTSEMMQNRGLKILAKVHRRCKHCRMMIKNGVFYNHCKVHPRHKQKSTEKNPFSTWVIAHAMQTRFRPW